MLRMKRDECSNFYNRIIHTQSLIKNSKGLTLRARFTRRAAAAGPNFNWSQQIGVITRTWALSSLIDSPERYLKGAAPGALLPPLKRDENRLSLIRSNLICWMEGCGAPLKGCTADAFWSIWSKIGPLMLKSCALGAPCALCHEIFSARREAISSSLFPRAQEAVV